MIVGEGTTKELLSDGESIGNSFLFIFCSCMSQCRVALLRFYLCYIRRMYAYSTVYPSKKKKNLLHPDSKSTCSFLHLNISTPLISRWRKSLLDLSLFLDVTYVPRNYDNKQIQRKSCFCIGNQSIAGCISHFRVFPSSLFIKQRTGNLHQYFLFLFQAQVCSKTN